MRSNPGVRPASPNRTRQYCGYHMISAQTQGINHHIPTRSSKKKIPALVATALSAVLMTSVGVQTTSAAEVTAGADDSSFSPSGTPGATGTTDGRFTTVRAANPERANGKGKGGRRYHVPTCAYFNNPRGSWNARLKIERQVMHAINNTKKGSVIRIAVYSFDRVPVAKALIRAKKRGVHVQLLLNDHQDTKAMKLMRRFRHQRQEEELHLQVPLGLPHRRPQAAAAHEVLHVQQDRPLEVGALLRLGEPHHERRPAPVERPLSDGRRQGAVQAVRRPLRGHEEGLRVRYPPIPTFCGIPANGVSCDDAIDDGTTVTFPRLLGPKNDPIVGVSERQDRGEHVIAWQYDVSVPPVALWTWRCRR